jgi:peptidoglycan/LPS O-acetylase OafA/YrhL
MLDTAPAMATPQEPSGVAVLRSQSLPQIPALTGLRFFAAFFILVAHASDWLGQFQNSEVRKYFAFLAMYGMPLFFVLSGFVIHYNYRRLFISRSVARASCEFAAARFARLFPLYFCLLLIAIAADDFVGKAYNQGNLWAKILAYYVTLTQSWWYIVYGNHLILNWLYTISWSISTEFYFYAAFVALVYAILVIRTPRQSLIAAITYPLIAILILLVVRYFLTDILGYAQPRVPDYIGLDRFNESFFFWLFYYSPYLRVLEFFMGCLAAHTFILHIDRVVTVRERFFANAALSLALIALGFFGACYLGLIQYRQLDSYVQFLSLNFLCAPAIAFILLYVSRYDGVFTRFMSAPMLVILGDASYSIYLIHTWTLRIFSRVPAPPFNWLWGCEALFRIICAIFLTLLVSYATYHLIEVPSRLWMRKKLKKMVAIGFGDNRTGLVPNRLESQSQLNIDDPESAQAVCTSPLPTRLIFSISMTFLLAALAVIGQVARSNYFSARIHRFWFGDRPEISVLIASYGLNCRDFPVPANFPKLTTPGNVTASVKQACDGRVQCNYIVDAFELGDPANGCSKDFSAEYFCTRLQETKTAFLPAEANGRSIVLTCAATK